MDKKTVRKAVLDALSQMSEEMRRVEDCKIYENVVKLDSYRNAETIFLYISVSHEADTRRIAEHALQEGKRIAVPRCVERGIMYAVVLNSLEELVPDRFGIPSAPSSSCIIDPEELDLILVPAIAFDRKGNRLGRGGGYYDRYLAHVPGTVQTVGICRALQLLQEISADKLDIPVQYVVTPDEIYRR